MPVYLVTWKLLPRLGPGQDEERASGKAPGFIQSIAAPLRAREPGAALSFH